jgi:hypothetical protein
LLEPVYNKKRRNQSSKRLDAQLSSAPVSSLGVISDTKQSLAFPFNNIIQNEIQT